MCENNHKLYRKNDMMWIVNDKNGTNKILCQIAGANREVEKLHFRIVWDGLQAEKVQWDCTFRLFSDAMVKTPFIEACQGKMR